MISRSRPCLRDFSQFQSLYSSLILFLISIILIHLSISSPAPPFIRFHEEVICSSPIPYPYSYSSRSLLPYPVYSYAFRWKPYTLSHPRFYPHPFHIFIRPILILTFVPYPHLRLHLAHFPPTCPSNPRRLQGDVRCQPPSPYHPHFFIPLFTPLNFFIRHPYLYPHPPPFLSPSPSHSSVHPIYPRPTNPPPNILRRNMSIPFCPIPILPYHSLLPYPH